MHAPAKAGARVFAVLALGLVPVTFHLVVLATRHASFAAGWSLALLLRTGVVSVSALTHWVLYAGLFTSFAMTLRPGREPLISGMARRLHGGISGELARYTRRATYAWSAFFAAQLLISITLFLFAPLTVWSFFVNVLDIPLVAAMFAAEYAVRIVSLKDPPRHSFSEILGMIGDVRKPRAEWASSQ